MLLLCPSGPLVVYFGPEFEPKLSKSFFNCFLLGPLSIRSRANQLRRKSAQNYTSFPRLTSAQRRVVPVNRKIQPGSFSMDSKNADGQRYISATEVVAGSYKFEINYLLTKNRFDIASLSSPKFTFGGLDWALVYWPPSSLEDNISLYLELQFKAEDVKVTFDISLVDRDGNPSLTAFKREYHTFSDKGEVAGFPEFVHKKVLEKEHLKKDGCFSVLCTLFIAGGSVSNNKVPKSCPVMGSPNSLHVQLGGLLNCQDTSDVIFEVDGEVFHAHRAILAARSPVFKAELYGPMAEARKECIKIEEMAPAVFKGLLHYLYTDSIEASANFFMYVQLVSAADRYAVDELKIMCEARLCRSLSLGTVISLLYLAEQHNCTKLRNACFEFITAPENLLEISLTDDYLKLMRLSPVIFTELREKAKCSMSFREATRKMPKIQ